MGSIFKALKRDDSVAPTSRHEEFPLKEPRSRRVALTNTLKWPAGFLKISRFEFMIT
jgi:hypothetical protein